MDATSIHYQTQEADRLSKKKISMTHSIKAYIDYCFPDDVLDRPAVLDRFLDKWVNTQAGLLWVEMCVEDDSLVIDLSCGFHCLHIPIAVIMETIEKAKEDTYVIR